MQSAITEREHSSTTASRSDNVTQIPATEIREPETTNQPETPETPETQRARVEGKHGRYGMTEHAQIECDAANIYLTFCNENSGATINIATFAKGLGVNEDALLMACDKVMTGPGGFKGLVLFIGWLASNKLDKTTQPVTA